MSDSCQPIWLKSNKQILFVMHTIFFKLETVMVLLVSQHARKSYAKLVQQSIIMYYYKRRKKEVKPISPNCTTMLAYIIQDHLFMQREGLFYVIGIL